MNATHTAPRSAGHTPFHAGELAAQRKAGFAAQAARVGQIISSDLSPGAQQFLAAQQVLFIGAVDDEGLPWASVLGGPLGFIHANDEESLEINAPLPGQDPLAGPLAGTTRIGALAMEAKTRRRLRFNGTADGSTGVLRVQIDQAYGNCPKYIQRRVPHLVGDADDAGEVTVGTELTAAQITMIAEADTFFVATSSAAGDVDASHRGGNPGFVEVASPARLRWPDYEGNTMMMTLGNIVENPRAGLLFIDWDTGTTLQLTGTARIDWEPGSAAAARGVERRVDLDITRVVQIEHANPLRWSEPHLSRFNPPVDQA